MGASRSEQLFDYSKKIIGYGSIVLLALALIVLIGQSYFRSFLEPMGLYFEAAGVFTDCSKRENFNHPFCNTRKDSATDKQWKLTRERPGFNITGM